MEEDTQSKSNMDNTPEVVSEDEESSTVEDTPEDKEESKPTPSELSKKVDEIQKSVEEVKIGMQKAIKEDIMDFMKEVSEEDFNPYSYLILIGLELLSLEEKPKSFDTELEAKKLHTRLLILSSIYNIDEDEILEKK